MSEGPVVEHPAISQSRRRMENMKRISYPSDLRNRPLGAWTDKSHRAARKFACIFGLPLATAKAIAELAGYVVEVRHG